MCRLRRFLVFVWGSVAPELCGPYDTDDARDEAARTLCVERGAEHGIFKLDIYGDNAHGISAYAEDFFQIGRQR